MAEEIKEPRKLTGEDITELANEDPSIEATCCCYWKETWTGWEKVRCTEEYATEDMCRSNTPSGLAYSFGNSGC